MEGKIEFVASLPPIQGALKLDGKDGNARVQLDIPGSDIAEAIKLGAYGRGKLLKVTIEIEEGREFKRFDT